MHRKGRVEPATKKPWLRTLILVLVTAVAAVAVTLATVTVTKPVEDPIGQVKTTTTSVHQGEVAASLSLNATAAWSSTPVGINRSVGIVTDVTFESGQIASPGATLFTVNLTPVVIAEGAVPSFRALQEDDSGADVKQLQTMLTALGFYEGEQDGVLRSGTSTAVRSWQKSLGIEPTGIVGLGDIIFVPSLTARLVLDETALHVGATLSGGEGVVSATSSSPVMTLPVTEAQAGMIPPEATVHLRSPAGGVWSAVTGAATRNAEDGSAHLDLKSADDGPICGEECDELPLGTSTVLGAEVVIVAPTSGLIVPSAALATDVDGSTVVVDRDGRRHLVVIKASANGMSVVEGVTEGLEIQVPAPSVGAAK